jgi:DNA-binding NtrC family response regulator
MPDATGPLLLYVEDQALILDLGVANLEEAGFAVTAFASGEKAMAALDAGGDFKALITDIDLGGGVSGWEVAKHARELFPEMPVIYVSGGSSNDWASMGVPGSVMLVKPYASAQLIVAVSSVMLGPEAPPKAG